MVKEVTWYVTFISIVFGVFISVWVQPLEGELITAAFPPKDLSDAVFLARGILMFLILVCLWWWYAIFLGIVHPANGFLMYLYEFATLAIFAIGFRYWDQSYLFPASVFFGSSFMLVRFYLTLGVVTKLSDEWWALIIALITLVTYVFIIVGAFGVLFLLSGISDEQKLGTVHIVVTVLLLVGFIATLLAVYRVEGFKWGDPKTIAGPTNEYGTGLKSE